MRLPNCLLMASLLFGASAQAAEDQTVNIYSYRQPQLIEPVLDAFTAETGIQVQLVFAKDGILERLKREGRYSPADLVLTSDFARLMELVEADLVQPVTSDSLSAQVPSQFRAEDGRWYALTQRVRAIYSSKDRVGPVAISYEQLAQPQFKGKICTRSFKHPYNVALTASLIAHHGEDWTRDWLKGVKANLARRPQGNDRAQVKAIKEGLCDYSLGNSYYYGKMLTDPAQKSWADAVHLNFPDQGEGQSGAHVNVSGMVLAKHAPNRAAAVKLMAFLSGDKAQQLYAQLNMEYPVKAGVAPSELVASWGSYRADSLAIEKVAAQRKTALRLLDEVRFDL